MLLTHALALSASQFVHKKKSPRIYTSMHSGGFELTKLIYTRLEDNLIRHRGDRFSYEPLGGLSISWLYYCDPPPQRLRYFSSVYGRRERGSSTRVGIVLPAPVLFKCLHCRSSDTFFFHFRQPAVADPVIVYFRRQFFRSESQKGLIVLKTCGLAGVRA